MSALLVSSQLFAETSYSTADVLMVRQLASKASVVLGMIPYGSEVDHTQHEIVADGYHWTWVHSAGGYVAREYLSKTRPTPGLKHLKLKASSSYNECDSDGYSGSDEIELGSGVFTYRGGGGSNSISTRILGTGKYDLVPGGIRLQFQSLGAFSNGTGQQLPFGDPPLESVQLTRVIYFDRNLVGFTLDSGRDSGHPHFFLGSLTRGESLDGRLIDIGKCETKTTGCIVVVKGYLCNR